LPGGCHHDARFPGWHLRRLRRPDGRRRVRHEQITVYTCTDDAAFAAAQDRAGRSDDSRAVITIPAKQAVIILTAYIGGDGG
jgi:hypothetical protein